MNIVLSFSRKHLSAIYLSCIMITGLAVFPIASAQDRTIEEGIVTAQKRSESVQDVPLGITALSADAIARAGITNTTLA